MGCSICLETYDDDADKSRRPVALPCGHIFHKACGDGWLKTCRMRSDVPTCPICKVHIGSSRPLSLYPSDGNDIDLYLANRHKFVARQELAKDRRAAPGTTALDRHMSREDQAKLLERLMDFRSHINSYVMGVNDVRMNYHGTEQEIYRLFDDLNRGGGKNGRDFKEALEALKEATGLLNECINDSEVKRQEIEMKHQQILAEAVRQQQERAEIAKGLNDKAIEEQKMHAVRLRYNTMEMHLKKELSKIESRQKEMDRERQAYIAEAKAKAHEALQAKIATAQQIAASKGESESEISGMRTYCIEQEQLRIKAEDEAREANIKSSQLADRVKLLSSKLSDSRAANLKLKKSRGSIGANSASVKQEERDESMRGTSKGKARQESMSIQSQAQLDDDGFAIVDVKPGLARSTSSSYQSGFGSGLANGSSIKRSRMSNEDDSIQIISSDDDEDDKSFFMPGFGVQSRPAASSSMLFSPYNHQNQEDINGDSSVEVVGDNINTYNTRFAQAQPSRYSNEGLIQSIMTSRALQYGPRLRTR